MILCAGESLIDMIPAAMQDGQIGFVPHVGGAVLNTAVALGRLGAEVAMLTGLSSDRFGQQIEQALRDSHVDPAPSRRSAHPSTLAFVHLSDGQASYQFYDQGSALQALASGTAPALPDGIRAAFFGGISLCNAPLGDVLADLARAAAAQVPLMVDPNVRPGFADDTEAYRARLTEMLAQADIVKVSDEDLDWLFPGLAPAELLTRGPRLVLLTRGADGAEAWHANGASARVAAPKVQVADTVGAGDSFNAGVLFDLDRNGLLSRPALDGLTRADLERALDTGVRVATVTVARSGANPPWAHEI